MVDEAQAVKKEEPVPAAKEEENMEDAAQAVKEEETYGFFQEANGMHSAMRLMCFVALLASIAFAFTTLWIAYHEKHDGGNGIFITVSFLIAAFAPKAVQKFAEQKVK